MLIITPSSPGGLSAGGLYAMHILFLPFFVISSAIIPTCIVMCSEEISSLPLSLKQSAKFLKGRMLNCQWHYPFYHLTLPVGDHACERSA